MLNCYTLFTLLTLLWLCVFMCYAGASKEEARSTTDQSREGNLVRTMFSF